MSNDKEKYTLEEWRAEAIRRFGYDYRNWKFVCPSCGHVASVQDWLEVNADDAVAFSCIGRWRNADGSNTFGKKGGPCNYAGGGLFRINPITVIDTDNNYEHQLFEFADADVNLGIVTKESINEK